MKLYFVRHGQTDWNAADCLQGRADIPLNATGLAQAEALRDQIRFQNLQFDAIYSSPLQRVRKTAEIIAGKLSNAQIIIDERLSEREIGEFTGKPSLELFDSEIDFLDPGLNAGDFGVEPINDFTGRVTDFLKTLPSTYSPDAKILVVTSNGVMKRAYSILTGNKTMPNFSNTELVKLTL